MEACLKGRVLVLVVIIVCSGGVSEGACFGVGWDREGRA